MRPGKKKFILLFIALLLFFPSMLQAQETTTFILVRHAEKVDDGTEDPGLSKKGKQRAQRLATHLQETNITAIYSTSYKRTENTVAQIARDKSLEIKEYAPFNPNVLDRILKEEQGGIVLISGHSDTTPFLVNQLIGKDLYEQLDESEYDNLYIVAITEKGKGQVIHLLY